MPIHPVTELLMEIKSLVRAMLKSYHEQETICKPYKQLMKCVELSNATDDDCIKICVKVFFKSNNVKELVNNFDGGYSPLHLAARIGDCKLIEFLVKNGADVNVTITDSKRTSLHLAAFYGHLDAVAALLKYGADVRATDKYGNTALFYCNKNVDILRCLVRYGCPINHLNKFRESVLCYTVDFDSPNFRSVYSSHDPTQYDAMTFLISSGANVRPLNKKGMIALLRHAFYHLDNSDLMTLVIRLKLNLLVKLDELYVFIFIVACSCRNGYLVDSFLLEYCIDVNTMSFEQKTIFEMACYYYNLGVTRRLLAFDCNININAENIVSFILLRIQNSFTFKNMICMLREHCEKLWAINRTTSCYYNVLFNIHKCPNVILLKTECVKQAKLLKQIEVEGGDSDRRVTCYDILVGSIERSVAYLRHLDPVSVHKTDVSKVPLYRDMILCKLRLASLRLSLIKALENQFAETQAFFFALPAICINIVLKYLTNSDLKRINEAISENPSVKKKKPSSPCHSMTLRKRLKE